MMKMRSLSRLLGITLLSVLFVLLIALVAQGAYQSAYSTATSSQHKRIGTSSNPLDFSCNDVTEIPQLECEALVALYNSTNGANWTNYTDWLITNTPCNWFGVSCLNSHVYLLNLPGNQLSGAIPTQLGDFPDLLGLYLAGNQLNGSIPTQLGNLSKLLDLNLANNQLSSSIPAQFGNLPSLTHLRLNNNQLSGSIPTQLGNRTGLVTLNLCCNQLSGNIPTQLGNLTSLVELTLSGNQLTGGIPPQLGNLTKLTTLGLCCNQLSNNVPAQLGNLTRLTFLSLDSNQLSGSLPSQLGNLVQLTELHLENALFSGCLPGTLTNLNQLGTFWFHNTSLYEPNDSAFQTWLAGIPNLSRTNVPCPNITVQFSSSNYSIGEDGGSASIQVSLGVSSDRTITVNYTTSNGTATAGSDYTARNEILTFNPGETSKSFTVPILEDTPDENDETINLTLSNPTNATLGTPANATLTIADNDNPPEVQFSSTSYSVGENGGLVSIQVTLSAASGKPVTVNYATGNGTAIAGSDYSAKSDALTFNPGQISQMLNVSITDDNLDEPNETVNLMLSNPNNASLGSPANAVLTIIDDDPSAPATNTPVTPPTVVPPTNTPTNTPVPPTSTPVPPTTTPIPPTNTPIPSTATSATPNPTCVIPAPPVATGDPIRVDHQLSADPTDDQVTFNWEPASGNPQASDRYHLWAKENENDVWFDQGYITGNSFSRVVDKAQTIGIQITAVSFCGESAPIEMWSPAPGTSTPTPTNYSIYGQVLDSNNKPILDVTISNDVGHTVQTDADGEYTFPDLLPGTYSLSPSKSGYTFSPTLRTVTVPPDAIDQNFTGTSTAVGPRPVVLVHGWNDTAASWEEYRLTFLPAIGLTGYAIDSMDTGFGDGTLVSIDENAQRLQEYIARVKGLTGAKQVDIVAHSMGGLIARRYIAKYMNANTPDVNQLIMLGTPNEGSKTADLLEAATIPLWLARELGIPIPWPSATQLTTNFVKQFNRDNPASNSVRFYAIAGNYRCLSLSRLPPSNPFEDDPDDVVVSRSSVFAIAEHGRWTYPSQQTPGCEGDHRRMRISGKNNGGPTIFGLYVSPLLRGQMPATPPEFQTFATQQTDASQTDQLQIEGNTLQFTDVQTSTLQPGGRLEFSRIPETGVNVSFIVVGQPDQMVVSLRDPNGQVITPNSTDPNIQYMQMDGEFMPITSYTISNPVPGIWTTIVEANSQTPTEGIGVAALGSLISDLRLTLPVVESSPVVHQSIGVTAQLQNGDTSLVGANVNAQLIFPDGTVTLTLLLDDGLHSDGSANDGLYGYQFTPVTPGVYSALISAEGINGDIPFQRSAVWAVQVDGNQVFLPIVQR
jgi:Leucine-rich repeat (LRR) protein/pimeloyl-ACP methyl ester carboxylesterase